MFFFLSRRRHTNFALVTWSSDVCSSVLNWSCKTNAQLFSGPTEYRFVNLSQVHTRRHTQWIQNNIHRTSVFQEWHIFFTYDTGHDALVSVAACHLISYLQLPLLGNIDLGHLDDARKIGRAHV